MEQGRELIALLALDDAGTRMCANRMRYANSPHLLRQVDMAVALGCETLILLAPGPNDSDALAAQHLAEANGLRFHLLTRPQQLPALVTEAADLLMLAPGVLAGDSDALHDLLGAQGLLTVPAESREAGDLERLDLHTVWGGALRMPAGLVAQIEPLGNECELLSALPRIARSSGVAERPVADAMIGKGSWSLLPGKVTFPANKQANRDISWSVIASLSRIFADRNWPVYLPLGLALALTAVAAVVVWFGLPAIGIAVLAAAMMAIALQKAVMLQADPMRLSGGARPIWTGIATLAPEAAAALAVGQALIKDAGLVPSTYAAAALLGASWLSRRTAVGGFAGLTSGPVFWLVIAGIGAVGFWWIAVGLATAAAFIAVALELRSSRRITGS